MLEAPQLGGDQGAYGEQAMILRLSIGHTAAFL